MSAILPLRPSPPSIPSPAAWVLLLCVPLVGAAGWMLFSHNGVLVDEIYHFRQIRTFREGVWTLEPKLTNLPGYHAVMTGASWVTGAESLNSLRLGSFLLGLLGLPIVFSIVRKLDTPWATIVTAQYLFFPLLLPFEFLLYTDPLGLECILLSLLLALDDCLWGSAIVAALGVMVRQPQITWVGFVCVLPYVRKHGLRLEWGGAVDHLRRGWLFLFGFAAFGVFLLVNGGVAMGDRSAHPDGGFYTGNIFFTLFLCAVVMLPLHLANLPRIVALVRNRPWWILILAGAFAIYWFICRFDHPYNENRWFLRNRLLRATGHILWWKVAFFGLAALSILSLAVTELKESGFRLLYPFAILNLVPSWLVEPRYALPSLGLLLVLRARRSWLLEWATLVWFALLSLLFIGAMSQRWFFL